MKPDPLGPSEMAGQVAWFRGDGIDASWRLCGHTQMLTEALREKEAALMQGDEDVRLRVK